jgi:hypothetical protein
VTVAAYNDVAVVGCEDLPDDRIASLHTLSSSCYRHPALIYASVRSLFLPGSAPRSQEVDSSFSRPKPFAPQTPPISMFFALIVRLLLHYYGFARLPEDIDAELISSFPQPNQPRTLADYLQNPPGSAQKTSAHAPGLRLRRVSLIARGFAIKLSGLPYHPTRSAQSILFSELNTEPVLSPVNA